MLFCRLAKILTAGKTLHAQDNHCLKISFGQVRVTNNVLNTAYRYTGYKEIEILWINVIYGKNPHIRNCSLNFFAIGYPDIRNFSA